MNEGLNISRSQNSGILIQFIDNSKKNVIPYLIFGTISIIFGVAIYYLLPKALLSFNLPLLLNIFFLIAALPAEELLLYSEFFL